MNKIKPQKFAFADVINGWSLSPCHFTECVFGPMGWEAHFRKEGAVCGGDGLPILLPSFSSFANLDLLLDIAVCLSFPKLEELATGLVIIGWIAAISPKG